MSYRAVEHACVGCGALLIPSTVSTIDCERCPRCDGIWIGTIAFFELLRTSPNAQHLTELMVQNDGTPRRACPHCQTLMDLAWIDFLQLDHCAKHGVWLDPGDIDRALSSAIHPDFASWRLLTDPKPRGQS
jgi:Zn-finger nucleic acid-binding protein